MMKVYGIKNCDSVKKALAFFKKHNLKYELFDFKTQELSCEKIENWVLKVGIKTLVNTRSTTYRNLKLKELNLNEQQQQEWLCKENLLIKRPVVAYHENIIVGFNEEQYERSFL